METKTTAYIGIVFLVLVIIGALALSYTGIATVGKFGERAEFGKIESRDRFRTTMPDSGLMETTGVPEEDSGIDLPTKAVPPKDSDEDGVPDSDDAFPNDPKEWEDFDSDGIGDNADEDDDEDGVNDFDATGVDLDMCSPHSNTNDPLWRDNNCLLNWNNQQTYLAANGCCTACSDMTRTDCDNCLELSEDCRWLGVARTCFDVTEIDESCHDWCNRKNIDDKCYNADCNQVEVLCSPNGIVCDEDADCGDVDGICKDGVCA